MPRVTLKSLKEQADAAEEAMWSAQEEYHKQVEGSQGGDEAAMKASEATYRDMEAKVDAWRKAHASHQKAAAFAGPAAGPDHEVDVPDRDAPPAEIPPPPSPGPSGYSPPVPTDRAPAPVIPPPAAAGQVAFASPATATGTAFASPATATGTASTAPSFSAPTSPPAAPETP